MKKFWSAIFLSAVMLGSVSLAACGETGQPSGSGADAPENKTVSTLGDFENMRELSDHFSFENRFGRVTLTEEKTYVTSGESAAKLEVYGDYNAVANIPAMVVNLSSFSENEKFDLTRLNNFTFDLYNAGEEEFSIEASLTIGGESTNYAKYAVAPGSNRITLQYNASALAVGYTMTEGQSLTIRFPKPVPENGGIDPQLHYTFYMDNLQVHYLQTAPEPMRIELDKDEVCSFDKAYQAYVMGVGGVGPCEGCIPEVSINTDLAYCKNLEGYSLKAVLPTGVAPLNDGWPYLYVINAVWEAAGLSEHVREGYELVFDVYSEDSHHFGVEIFHETYPTVALGSGFDTSPRSWTEVRIPLSQMLVYNEKGQIEKDYTQGMTAFAFTYGKFSTPDKVIYFDNMRFEKSH